MTSQECKKGWDMIINIYNQSKESPSKTIGEVIEVLGQDVALEVFATVSKIKIHDGRIYGENREFMNKIPVNSESVLWEASNPMIYEGLDRIHPTHINQLITALSEVNESQ